MSNPYRKIFAAPGAARFTAAGFFGRMTLSMMGVGMITLVSQVTGRYGLAGALAATFALAAAVIGPQTSRLVDRHGQARVLRPVTLVAVAAVAGFLMCLHRDAQEWVLFLFATGIGCAPNVGSMVKARWAEVHQGSPRDLHTAYSWEAVVDEVCYIVGPIVSIGLSTVWFPQAGVVLAGAFLSVGVLWLTAQRGTEPAPHPRAAHDEGSALRSGAFRCSSPPMSPLAPSSAPSTWSRWRSPRSAATRAPRASCSPRTRSAPALRASSSA